MTIAITDIIFVDREKWLIIDINFNIDNFFEYIILVI